MVEPVLTVQEPLLDGYFALHTGTLLGGRYRLAAEEREGNGGRLFHARDEHARPNETAGVAVKLLHPGIAGDAQLINLLENELSVIRQAASPHLIAYYRLERDGANAYLVREWVHGSLLFDLLRWRRSLKAGELPALLEPLAGTLDLVAGQGLGLVDVSVRKLLLACPPEVEESESAARGDLKHWSRCTLKLNPLSLAPLLFRSRNGWDRQTIVPSTRVLSMTQAEAGIRGAKAVQLYGRLLYELLSGRPPSRVNDPGRYAPLPELDGAGNEILRRAFVGGDSGYRSCQEFWKVFKGNLAAAEPYRGNPPPRPKPIVLPETTTSIRERYPIDKLLLLAGICQLWIWFNAATATAFRFWVFDQNNPSEIVGDRFWPWVFLSEGILQATVAIIGYVRSLKTAANRDTWVLSSAAAFCVLAYGIIVSAWGLALFVNVWWAATVGQFVVYLTIPAVLLPVYWALGTSKPKWRLVYATTITVALKGASLIFVGPLRDTWLGHTAYAAIWLIALVSGVQFWNALQESLATRFSRSAPLSSSHLKPDGKKAVRSESFLAWPSALVTSTTITTAALIVGLVIFAEVKSRFTSGDSVTPAASPAPSEAVATPTTSPTAASADNAFEGVSKEHPWENSLGMKFVPVPSTDVLFSIWDTRVQDFAPFIEQSGYNAGSEWKSPKFKQWPGHPVVGVDWNDANAFCAWLTKTEHADGRLPQNKVYRLPTDAEWSTAAGLWLEAGSTPQEKDARTADLCPWGKQWPPPAGSGNFAGEESGLVLRIEGYNDGWPRTSPVGSLNANKFGLYDMSGNIFQWCEDWFDAEKQYRVSRGSCWDSYDPGALSLSSRSPSTSDFRWDRRGFRCVLGSQPSQ